MNEIPVARPRLAEEEVQAAADVIRSGWVTQGPQVAAFETAIQRFTGAPHACAVSNCTSALQLALLGVGVKPGDVVVTVSGTFIATVNAVRACQAEPFFVDIDPTTLNMDAEALEHCLATQFKPQNEAFWLRDPARLMVGESPLVGRSHSPSDFRIGRLSAILVVHQLGLPAEIDRIVSLAKQYGIPVVEDAACALGSEVQRVTSCEEKQRATPRDEKWEPIGRPVADVACFSFHPRKVITTGDGGMLTTRRPELDEKFRLWRHQGMSISDTQRHNASSVAFEEYSITAFNYRMTDIQAALGVVQMDRLHDILACRRQHADEYLKLLEGVPGITLPLSPSYTRPNFQSFQIQLDSPQWQRPIMQALRDDGIHSRRGVMCAHLEAPYRDAWPAGCLPISERCMKTGLTLPLYPDMTSDDVQRVCRSLHNAIDTASQNIQDEAA